MLRSAALHRFRSNRRGYYSLWILCLLFLLSACAPLLSNDKPLFLKTPEGRVFFPVFSNCTQDDVLGNGSPLPVADWQAVAQRPGVRAVFPIFRSGAHSVFSTETLDPYLRPVNGNLVRYPAAAFWLTPSASGFQITRTAGNTNDFSGFLSSPSFAEIRPAIEARLRNEPRPAFEAVSSGVSLRLPAFKPRTTAPDSIRIDIRPADWRTAPPMPVQTASPETAVLEQAAFPFRPIPGHPFGFDAAGHDVFARVLYATFTSLAFGLLLTLSSLLLGILAGSVQGYFAGWADLAGQRFTEIWSAIPFLYVMIFLGNTFGRSFGLLLLCYAIFNWIGVAAYIRAEFLRLRNRPFVDAARCQALSHARIMFAHILPNALTPIITLFPFMLVGAIGALAALDYLGFGLPDGQPSWGELLSQAQSFRGAWWLVLYPSLALFLVILLGVFIGEALRDAFDPRPVSALDVPQKAKHPSSGATTSSGDSQKTQASLEIRNLAVEFDTPAGIVHAVNGVSLSLKPGETLAIVGESGCGKSVTAMSVLRLVPSPPSRCVSGEILLNGRDLRSLPLSELRKIRGASVGMVFQDPMTALSPLHRIGDQLLEALRLHKKISRTEGLRIAADWLDRCGIPNPAACLRQYPFQLSGGMQQRVMIASVLMTNPSLIIADEPTTALDVTVQAQVLELMRNVRPAETSLLLITHNMAVVRSVCTRVAVMYAGTIVESGTVDDVFAHPKHPYTIALLNAMPCRHRPGEKHHAISGSLPSPISLPPGCAFAPRCPYALETCRTQSPPAIAGDESTHCASCFRQSETAKPPVPSPSPATNAGFRHPSSTTDISPILQVNGLTRQFPLIRAVDDLSLSLFPGEVLAVVGESGSGKTTFARMIAGLEKPDAGSILLRGAPLPFHRSIQQRRTIQMVFQDPFSSLNPRRRIASQLTESLVAHGLVEKKNRLQTACELLAAVGLPPEAANRSPNEFSGGQLQRISIARALAMKPEILICDEPVSALDVSVQAQILNLLDDLRRARNLACIFITHDLGVVRSIADRIAVLHKGRLVELGPASQVLSAPQNEYTRTLLAAEPKL
ncbi:MAG: dipeptide ABC transporter ATP-binding protein [Kiritimatiellia bacterium]